MIETINFSDPASIPDREKLRDEWGANQYAFAMCAKHLGFLAPPWANLPEDVRESYRVLAVNVCVGHAANLMREYEKTRRVTEAATA
jgi:hypothetical protein